jgi:hypothetical protein
MLHHLGIPCHDAYGSLFSRVPDGGHDPLEKLKRKTFLDDQGEAKIGWNSPDHGKVVDGSTHSQLSDVAAREEERVDHIGVCGERKRPFLVGDSGTVIEGLQKGVEKPGEQNLAHQIMREFSTASMG